MERSVALDGISAFHNLKEQLKIYLKQFAESGQVVSQDDIYAFFEVCVLFICHLFVDQLIQKKPTGQAEQETELMNLLRSMKAYACGNFPFHPLTTGVELSFSLGQ